MAELGHELSFTHNLDRVLPSCYASPEDVAFSNGCRVILFILIVTKSLQPFNGTIMVLEKLELWPFTWR